MEHLHHGQVILLGRDGARESPEVLGEAFTSRRDPVEHRHIVVQGVRALRPSRDEQLDDLRVGPEGREVKRTGPAGTAAGGDVGSVREERLYRSGIPVLRGEM